MGWMTGGGPRTYASAAAAVMPSTILIGYCRVLFILPSDKVTKLITDKLYLCFAERLKRQRDSIKRKLTTANGNYVPPRTMGPFSQSVQKFTHGKQKRNNRNNKKKHQPVFRKNKNFNQKKYKSTRNFKILIFLQNILTYFCFYEAILKIQILFVHVVIK